MYFTAFVNKVDDDDHDDDDDDFREDSFVQLTIIAGAMKTIN